MSVAHFATIVATNSFVSMGVGSDIPGKWHEKTVLVPFDRRFTAEARRNRGFLRAIVVLVNDVMTLASHTANAFLQRQVDAHTLLSRVRLHTFCYKCVSAALVTAEWKSRRAPANPRLLELLRNRCVSVQSCVGRSAPLCGHLALPGVPSLRLL